MPRSNCACDLMTMSVNQCQDLTSLVVLTDVFIPLTVCIWGLVLGSSGSRCEVDEDNCANVSLCDHSGMCKDERLGFSCLCRTTDIYTGKLLVQKYFNKSLPAIAKTG